MTEKIHNDILHMISLELGIPVKDIHLQSDIMKDLGADSLDISGLMGSIESQYKIKISEEDAAALVTVNDVIEHIKKKQSA